MVSRVHYAPDSRAHTEHPLNRITVSQTDHITGGFQTTSLTGLIAMLHRHAYTYDFNYYYYNHLTASFPGQPG